MEDQIENSLDLKHIVTSKPDQRVKTHDVRWLRLDDIYQKFYRPNFYDIGGTYVADNVADFWFLYKTEQVGNLFLLHLFVTSHQVATFTVAVSFSNDLKIDKRNSAAYLPTAVKDHSFVKTKEHSPSYITTYSFTDLDIEFLENKSLYIAAKFPLKGSASIDQEIIDLIKYRHDFSALLTEPVGSDFTIESCEGEKFNVHKVLLVAHSEVFKAMLKEDTAESQNGFVRLVDVTSDDLKHILEFIYSGTIKDIENCNFCNLLVLADQYNLKGLRDLSEYILSKQLTAENALETLVLADLYNSETLKIAAMKFVKGNKKSLYSNTFKEIKSPDLLQELCQYLAAS